MSGWDKQQCQRDESAIVLRESWNIRFERLLSGDWGDREFESVKHRRAKRVAIRSSMPGGIGGLQGVRVDRPEVRSGRDVPSPKGQGQA